MIGMIFFCTLLVSTVHNRHQVPTSDIKVLAQDDGILKTGKHGSLPPQVLPALQFSSCLRAGLPNKPLSALNHFNHDGFH